MSTQKFSKFAVNSGTPVQIDVAGLSMRLGVKANPENGGTIWIGESTVDASSKVGFPLGAGEVYIFDGVNDQANNLYIDGDNTGDILHVEYRKG